MLGVCDSELHIRNAAKSTEQCHKYLELDLDVNARDTGNMGYTALHYAAKWDRIEVLAILMAAGADHLLKNWEGETPLVLARKRGNYGFVRALQEELENRAAPTLGKSTSAALSAAPSGQKEDWYSLPEGVKTTTGNKSPIKRASVTSSADFSKDVEEVMDLTERFNLSLSDVQSIKAGFSEWDRSNTGAISLADIEHVMNQAQMEFDSSDIQAMSTLVNPDGLITFSAFMEAAANRLKKLRPNQATDRQDREKQQRVESPTSS